VSALRAVTYEIYSCLPCLIRMCVLPCVAMCCHVLPCVAVCFKFVAACCRLSESVYVDESAVRALLRKYGALLEIFGVNVGIF